MFGSNSGKIIFGVLSVGLCIHNSSSSSSSSSILKNNCIYNSSSSGILKNNYLNDIGSDTDISDFLDLPAANNNKPTECAPITKQNISIHSHSEQLLSQTSGVYECFYLFDDNNKEQSIIDEKKDNQIIINDDIIIDDYFTINNIQNKNNIYSPIPIEKQIKKKSIHPDNNITYNNECLSDDDSLSENEYKPNKSTFKINVPKIKIPQTRNDYLKPVRPAYKLHLDMIDNDGSIKREIMEHRQYCQKINKIATDINNNKCDQNINNNETKCNVFSKHRKHKPKQRFSFKKKLCNVFNYFIFENKCEVDMKFNVDYF